MVKLENIARNNVSERQLFVLNLPRIAALPEKLDLQSKYFGVFLACDAQHLADDVILKLARALIAQGMRYFVSWGGDCERVHDLFDLAIIEHEPHETEASVIITMWDEEKSLDEALWAFLYVAFPANDYWDDCQADLIIEIGHSDWTQQIKTRLLDLDGLNKDVVGEDDEEGN